mgnify:CR=1 FL=1
MDLHICKDIKTIFITYPKCGSNTCNYALQKQFGDNFTKVKLNWTRTGVREFQKQVPKEYRVHAFVRDPVERWISGLVFLSQTSYNLFYSDISNVKENIANANDQWYMNYFNSIVQLNNWEGTLADAHMARWIYPLFLVQTLTSNMTLHDVYSMDTVMSNAYGTEPKTIEKMNTAEVGYGPGFLHSNNQEHIPTIKKRFERLLSKPLNDLWDPFQRSGDSPLNAIRGYLDLEKFLFRRINDINKDPMLFFEKSVDYVALYHSKDLKTYSDGRDYKAYNDDYYDVFFADKDDVPPESLGDMLKTNAHNFCSDHYHERQRSKFDR